MMNWFNKNNWYHEPANFVLINNSDGDLGESDTFGVSEAGIISYFGEPIKRLEKYDYIVLVYDRDLSKTLGI